MIKKFQFSAITTLYVLILWPCGFFTVVHTTPKKAADIEYELVQGDMLLPKKSILSPLSGLRDENYRWPNAVVPYEIDSGFSREEQQVILGAMAEIARKTCVQFIPRVYEEDFVRIVHDRNGCFSNVGRVRGDQIVNLGNGCVDHGTAIHELTHSLGFFHEQSRPDRDQHVEILWNNIEEDKKDQFRIMHETEVTTFNIDYDYDSVMHYGRYDFSKYGNQAETIRPKPYPNVEIGQRRRLSSKDALKIRRMYKMSDYGSCSSSSGGGGRRIVERRTTTTTNAPWYPPRPSYPDRPTQWPGNTWWPIERPVPRRPSWFPSWFPW